MNDLQRAYFYFKAAMKARKNNMSETMFNNCMDRFWTNFCKDQS